MTTIYLPIGDHTSESYVVGAWPDAEALALRVGLQLCAGIEPILYIEGSRQELARRLCRTMTHYSRRVHPITPSRESPTWRATIIERRRSRQAAGHDRARDIAVLRSCWVAGSPRATLRRLAAAARAQGLAGAAMLAALRRWLTHASGHRGVAVLRARLDRVASYVADPRRETLRATRTARLSPYLVMTYTPHLAGRAARYRRHYSGVRVIRSEDGQMHAINHHLVTAIRDWGGLYTGGPRSQGGRAMIEAEALARARNKLHQHAIGYRALTLDDIAAEPNTELQREMIEAWPGGWDGYVASAGARTLHIDETGHLIEIATAAEPIRAVRVVCPTTGRQYVLRVPPAMATAREAVAWTFGLTAEDYQPARQS